MAEGRVKFQLCSDVHPVGSFGITRAPNVGFLAADMNACDPKALPLVLRDALKAGLVFMRQTVLAVFARRNNAKVAPSVVISHPVPMVNFPVWQSPCHVQKRQPMRAMAFPVYANVYITVRGRSYHLPNLSASGTCGNEPSKFSRCWIVMENFFEPLFIHWLNMVYLLTVRKGVSHGTF